MRSQRGGGPGSSILAAALVLLSAATSVRAQPGFGPDPFWPYNNQYTPYTTAIGPAAPEAGGRGTAREARDGLRGANQFQNYLENLSSGPGRNVSDRSNIGMPYYRSAVDPTSDAIRSRQYEPRVARSETYQETQRRMADLYFRYYGERDPSRRAELLKEYRGVRHDSMLALSGRSRSTTRPRESATGLESGSRRESRTTPAAPRPGAVDRARSRLNGVGAAPEIPLLGPARSSSPRTRRDLPSESPPEMPPLGALRSSSPRARRDLPSDILNRSQAIDELDRFNRVLSPRSGSPGLSSRPRRPSSTQPAPTDPATTPPADSDRP